MAANKLHLTITNVHGSVFAGAVDSVTLPGSTGELTLLAHHEAFISTLKEGVITVRADENQQTFDVHDGLLEVAQNRATVLL